MYIKYIDPVSVRAKAVELVAPHAKEGSNWTWWQPAVIFDYVRENINYVPDPVGGDHFAPPLQVLESGGGDCDDQAILFASMCISVGIRARLIKCHTKNGSGHMLAEVCYEKSNSEEVIQDLFNYYYYLDRRRIYWERDAFGNLWMIADLTGGRNLGDITGLENGGFVTVDPDTFKWKWTEDVQVEEPKIREATVLFFESDYDLPDKNKRKYKNIFSKTLSRYINWELFLRIVPPGQEVDSRFIGKWYRKKDNSLYTQNEDLVKIGENWESAWPARGWGKKDGNAFEPGEYKVDIFIESNYLEEKKYSGEFEVY